jgi:acyl-CoA thioester hydrolase
VAHFTHRLRVRFHECDAQGVVFNANHITYVDVTLTELWRAAFGSYGSMVASGFDLVVADVHAAFRAPVRFDDELDVHLTVQRFGRTSMTSSWTSVVGDRTCVEGEIVHVCVDATTMQPVEIPQGLRDALAPWTASG